MARLVPGATVRRSARQAKDSDLIQYATEIKVRAERRCGELLVRTAETGERATREKHGRGGQVASFDQLPPTLAEMGLTANESSRCQQLAAMPAEAFADRMAQRWGAAAPDADLPLRLRLRAAVSRRRGAKNRSRRHEQLCVEGGGSLAGGCGGRLDRSWLWPRQPLPVLADARLRAVRISRCDLLCTSCRRGDWGLSVGVWTAERTGRAWVGWVVGIGVALALGFFLEWVGFLPEGRSEFDE